MKTLISPSATYGKIGLMPAGVGKGRARWSLKDYPFVFTAALLIAHLSRSLQLPPAFIRAAPVSGAKAPSTRCLISSATRLCPAACLFDFASAALRHVAEVAGGLLQG